MNEGFNKQGNTDTQIFVCISLPNPLHSEPSHNHGLACKKPGIPQKAHD